MAQDFTQTSIHNQKWKWIYCMRIHRRSLLPPLEYKFIDTTACSIRKIDCSLHRFMYVYHFIFSYRAQIHLCGLYLYAWNYNNVIMLLLYKFLKKRSLNDKTLYNSEEKMRNRALNQNCYIWIMWWWKSLSYYDWFIVGV